MGSKGFHIKFLPVLLAALLVFGGVPLCAQESPALEEVAAEEPSAEGLALPEEEKETEPENKEAAPQEAAVEEGITDSNATDALPAGGANISRVRIETKGFGLAAARNINVYPGDNPGEMSQEEFAEDIRQEAFDAALTGLFPLKPEDIETLLKHYDRTERAAQSPPYDLPRPEVSVQTISMDPGVMPPVIKTAVGHVTTVNILDITGAPWPVQDITWAGDFEIVEPEEGGHIIRITPMTKFGYGNMSVRLLTLKTPVTFALRVGRDSVHYRMDARIPEFGPFAQAQLMEGRAQLVAGSSTLTTVLDGVPPPGAVRLSVAGTDGRTSAYKVGGLTYVRTPLTLLSPGWESSVSSADGMNVYALNNTPVLLLSDKGQFIRAKLKEQKDLFDE